MYRLSSVRITAALCIAEISRTEKSLQPVVLEGCLHCLGSSRWFWYSKGGITLVTYCRSCGNLQSECNHRCFLCIQKHVICIFTLIPSLFLRLRFLEAIDPWWDMRFIAPEDHDRFSTFIRTSDSDALFGTVGKAGKIRICIASWKDWIMSN